ncbi:hypothetical protein AKJ37_01365 [candidate division MSBL1 archaeon SCGC-AAA259I09]|uniref:Exosome subunit n=3 Tax=candidate division MSBL1 TaxID=215777 RepID=A0A133UV59_9EURY|nr:hypothetical protein AKJ62_00500 [candidate division MSBL1 archaeon SCGC-AAA259D14]KXA93567.1 hypothetical protein AKJ66_01665 [candidate division MSBL1 archaeon SCGC-AAA259E22]KXA98084.1 hypothetical protein AKJ37_01365 [candidate division MSBL1 archaeon SCGC-AAA259I09]
MKVPFKSVGISTFVHATESEKKLRNTLKSLLPDEIKIEKEEAEGHFGEPIFILSADFQRRPYLREFWNQILEKLVENERRWLEKNAIERIGDDCRLYLRFDKQTAVSEDKLKIADTDDVIHVRINISAYPAKRKIAIEKMKKFIEDGLKRE